MTKKVWEHDADDMDERFGSGGFSGAGGNMQSLSFALTSITHILGTSPVAELLDPLTRWTTKPHSDTEKIIEGFKAVIYDMGCAEGDGTAAISHFFPLSDITGIDISPVAIERAKFRWPHLKFEVGDIAKPEFDEASIIFTSHTIEHMEYPAEVIQGLLARCSLLIVIVPPIEAGHRKGGHIGAKPYKEWVAKLPEPLYTKRYNTLRPDLDKGGCIEEGNVLMLWKGDIQG